MGYEYGIEKRDNYLIISNTIVDNLGDRTNDATVEEEKSGNGIVIVDSKTKEKNTTEDVTKRDVTFTNCRIVRPAVVNTPLKDELEKKGFLDKKEEEKE